MESRSKLNHSQIEDLLLYDINEFLAQYKVNTHACSIYLDTLFELAGITTTAHDCSTENGSNFSIKDLSETEAQQFVAFLNSYGEGKTHFTKLYGGWSIIGASSEIFYYEIFPLFRQRVTELAQANPEKLAKYQEASKQCFPDNPTPFELIFKQSERAIMENIRENKSNDEAEKNSIQLFDDLKSFLRPYKISTSSCDIFEETLLKIAGVIAQPKGCNFGFDDKPFTGGSIRIAMDPYGTGRIRFTIKGLNDEDAIRFANYFIQQGDRTTLIEKYSDSYHAFNVDAEALYQKILPAFKEKIIFDAEHAPTSLQKYRDLSEKDFKAQHAVSVIEVAQKEEPLPVDESSASVSCFGFFRRVLGIGGNTNDNREEERMTMRR